jgi:protein O-mannosyl-transferase
MARGKHREERAPSSGQAALPDTGLGPELGGGTRHLLLALVFVASFLPFLPALGQGFVQWDDDYNFEQNPMWRGLSGENLHWMFTTFYMGHYQPLSWLSFGIEHALWGVDPERMHLVNALLHALNATLVALLFVRLFSAQAGAAGPLRARAVYLGAVAAALFFSMHPLRVESVAWATERRDVLSTCFLLLCVLAWLRTLESATSRGLWWGVTLACYALSLLSKAWGMTLPALLLVLDVYPLGRWGSSRSGGQRNLRGLARLALEKWPFVPLALASAYLASSAQASMQAAVTLEDQGILARLVQAAWGLAFYVRKTVFPSGLAPLYELEAQLDVTRPQYLLAAAGVAVAAVALVLARKRWPAGLAAFAAYAIAVSPVLGLLQSGAQKAADRYSYLACIPLALLLGGLVARIGRDSRPGEPSCGKLGPARPARLGALSAIALACLALGAASYQQTKIWKDSETLWRRVIEVQPASYIAHHNLSVTLHIQGRLTEAIASEQRSIEVHPGKGNQDAYYHLGQLYQMQGKGELAEQTWRDSLAEDVAPDHLPSLQELSRVLAARRDLAGVRALWERAVALRPAFCEGHMELARQLAGENKLPEAQAHWRAALAADPHCVPAALELARSLLAQGRSDEAEPLLRTALVLEPANPEALTELGGLRIAQGRTEEARLCLERALAMNPGLGRARMLLQRLPAPP